MRLVDVEEILADADDAYSETLKECDDEWSKGTVRRIHTAIRAIVNCRPTAYDIDKVIENIKNSDSIKCYGSLNSGNYLIPVDEVIKIVKSGGIDE